RAYGRSSQEHKILLADEVKQHSSGCDRKEKKMRLLNKKIVITGGAQGMGEAMINAYLSEGAQIVSMDINALQGEAVIASLPADLRPRAHFVPLDVTDPVSTNQAIDQ